MIKFSWKSLVIVVAAFGIGAGAYLALGASPEKVVPKPPVDPEWKPVEARVQDLALADARWSEFSPWGAVPKPVEAPPPPPPPPPMAVGIVKTPRGPQAIFMIHDAGEIRVAPGGSLPGGGRLLRIAGFRITWIDAKGLKQEREMFTAFKPASAPDESRTDQAATIPAPSEARRPRRSTQAPQTTMPSPPPTNPLTPGLALPKPPGTNK